MNITVENIYTAIHDYLEKYEWTDKKLYCFINFNQYRELLKDFTFREKFDAWKHYQGNMVLELNCPYNTQTVSIIPLRLQTDIIIIDTDPECKYYKMEKILNEVFEE